jgi:tetratricopeptide (TPR) repeat protein
MRSLLALIVALSVALPVRATVEPPTPAPAPETLQDPRAQEHLKRAQAHFDAEAYAKAVPELKAAYAIEPKPFLLYAWAQAERMTGNCRKAVPLYERFLTTNPDAQQRRYAETNILDCAAETEEGGDTDPPDPFDTEAGAEGGGDEAGDDEGDVDPIKPAYKDWLGATFVGLGVAGMVVGGVLIAVGQQEVRESSRATSEDDYFDQVDAGTSKHTAGIVVLGVGGALLLAGVIRYAVLGAKNRKKRKAQAGLILPRRGVGLGLELRF